MTPIRSRIVGSITAVGIILAAISQLAAAEGASKAKHCLWRVTNAKAPFYFLGSVHALQPSDYERAAVIEDAIKQSQQIFFELDPKEHEVFAKNLREAARLPRGQQILGKISPKTYAYLRKITTSGMNE